MKSLSSHSRRRLAWASIGLAVLVSEAGAQAVFTAPSALPAPTLPRAGLGGPKPVSYSSINSAFANLAPLAKWASVSFRPMLSYSFQYGDGFLRVPGEPVNSTIQTLGWGFQFELGKHWSLDYSGTRIWNSSRLLADYTSHRATLSGRLTRDDWTLGVFQSYSTSQQTRVETGQQTPEENYTTGGNVSYQVGPRSLIDFQVSRNWRETELSRSAGTQLVPEVEQWSATGLFHYRVTSKLDLALGMSWGYDRISTSSDMRSSQPQASIEWQPTSRIVVSAQAGIETRTFQGGRDELDSNVYSASAAYSPTTTTTVTIGTSRSISPSYFVNQVSRSTGWMLNLQQRVLQRYYVTAAASEGRNSYVVTSTNGFPVSRADKFDSLRFGISTPFAVRGSVSLSYQTSDNRSDTKLYEFTSHTFGVDVVYRF